MTSSTGGTSALTCSAQTGYPLVSEAFTGTRFVEYSIVEYTSSAKTQPSKAETGIGSYNTSTEVLTRTKVLSTWDATDYLPKFGTATAPTALNFGTTSANIDIMVGPMAAGSLPPVPFATTSLASVSDGLGAFPINVTMSGSGLAMTSGTVSYSPVLISHHGPFSQVSIRSTTALTGGSPTFDAAIYEVGSDGFPGKRLIAFTQLTGIQTTDTTYTSTALATPVYLTPGWYWQAGLWLAGGASGTFTPRIATIHSGGPQGVYFSNSTGYAGAMFLNSQSALNDPATAPGGRTNSASSIAMAYK